MQGADMRVIPAPRRNAGSKPRVGLGAQLVSAVESFRNAGVSHYVHNLLLHLPVADPLLDYVAFLPDRTTHYPGWACRGAAWGTRSPLSRILWEQLAQPTAARRERLCLLHAPVNIAPALVSCPVVVTVHDLSFFLFPQFFRPPNRVYQQVFTRATAQNVEHIIAVSQSTRADVCRILGVPPGRVTVVPNGVDAEMRPLSPEQVQAFRVKKGLPERIILFVGTLEPRKNIPNLLEAYSLLRRESRVDHHLVIVGGKGWYFDEIEETSAQLGLGDEVIFPGFVPQAELPYWYNAADLFVFPSLYEGFGLPPLEAMACGTPVIVSTSSSLPEVVGDAGLLVDARDPRSLAEAMRSVAEDRGRREQLALAGLGRARTFSWHETARQTAAVYHRVLGETPGHA